MGPLRQVVPLWDEDPERPWLKCWRGVRPGSRHISALERWSPLGAWYGPRDLYEEHPRPPILYCAYKRDDGYVFIVPCCGEEIGRPRRDWKIAYALIDATPADARDPGSLGCEA